MDNFQEELFNMLVIVNKILKEEKLEYFLIGGSALGVVRHGGFIPWDDDIDIGLYRKDFEKFEEIIEKKLPKDLLYCKIGENKIPNAPIGYLYDISNPNVSLEKVPTIDFFPLDNVPDSKILKRIQDFFAKVYHLAIYKRPAKNRGRLAKFITRIILYITPNFILKILEKISKKVITFWKNKETQYINNIFGANNECVRREVIGKSVYMKFEGIEFPIPERYDEYLRNLYNDYMKLPPKEFQKAKHNRK